MGSCPEVCVEYCLTLLRTEKMTDRLEALIDPFDLDVFTPHLNSNLNRLVQRTSVSWVTAMLSVSKGETAESWFRL